MSPFLALALVLLLRGCESAVGASNYSAYTCTKGFDCYFQHSCPAYEVRCPLGYFCGDTTKYQVTAKGSYPFGYGRMCPQAVRCPTTVTAETCPKGRWCELFSVDGNECDAISSCPSPTYIQLTAVPLLIAAMWAVGVIALSIFFSDMPPNPTTRETNAVMLRNQHKTKSASRQRLLPKGRRKGGGGLAGRIGAIVKARKLDPFTRLFISFERLTVTLPDGRTILNRISGTFKPGQLVAIMGPSGAGKSTVVKAIIGDVPFTDGHVDMNGSSKNNSVLRREIGFVPQDDIMDPALSVREVLTHSAMTRLPQAFASMAKVSRKVDDALVDLGLWGVQHSLIGDAFKRGISGGEKKRVSIGIELVANPSALFLDEPTSGLDASAAEEVAQILRRLSRTGRIVVAILHQPRFESFEQFDKCMLLTRGGNVCYYGRASRAVRFFAEMDPVFEMPRHKNPANHLLDIISGRFDNVQAREGKDGQVRGRALQKHLPEMWTEFESKIKEGKKALRGKGWRVGRGDAKRNGDAAGAGATQKAPSRHARTPLHRLLLAFLLRAFRLQLRNRWVLCLYTVLSIFFALVLSLAFTPLMQEEYTNVYFPPLNPNFRDWCPKLLVDCSQPLNDLGLKQMTFFLNVAVGSISMIIGSQLFSEDLSVTLREARAGVPVWLEALVKMIVDLNQIMFYAATYIGVWMLFGHPGAFGDWLRISMAIAWAASGVGNIIGLSIQDKDNAPTLCVVVSLCMATFNGTSPRLKQLGTAAWLWAISYTRWSSEAIYTIYTQHHTDNHQDVRGGADIIGFSLERLNYDIGAIWGIGMLARFVAVLVLQNRVKGYAAALHEATAKRILAIQKGVGRRGRGGSVELRDDPVDSGGVGLDAKGAVTLDPDG